MSDIYVACEIERGAFTNERAFEIRLSDRVKTRAGETNGILAGSAHRMHLLDSDKKPLGEDEPPFGVKLNGYVRCQKIREFNDGSVLIEVPSADLIHVPMDDLVRV